MTESPRQMTPSQSKMNADTLSMSASLSAAVARLTAAAQQPCESLAVPSALGATTRQGT
jgi:hypothetical protein